MEPFSIIFNNNNFLHSPLDLESEVVRQVPGIEYAHPTILYVVRKVMMMMMLLLAPTGALIVIVCY